MPASYPLLLQDLVIPQFDRRTLRYVLDGYWPKQANTTIRHGRGSPRSFSPAAALLLYVGAALHKGGIDREGARVHLAGLWQHHERLNQIALRQPKRVRGVLDRYGHAHIIGLRPAMRPGLYDPRKAPVTTSVDLSQLAAMLPVAKRGRGKE